MSADDPARAIEPVIPALRRYAAALAGNRHDGDDLVQDCLERGVARWRQRRDDGDVRAWLFAILHNLAMDAHRRDRRRKPMLGLVDCDEAKLAVVATQGDALDHAAALRALDRLPPDQRGIILLVSVEDLTYQQAADVLGVPIGTVMSRLSRARARYAAILADDGAVAGSPALRSVS